MQQIESLLDISSEYDTFLIDQWGVLHNGQDAFINAVTVLNELSKLKNIIILSNSGKRSINTYNKLQKIGYSFLNKESVVTSGEFFYNLCLNEYQFIKQKKIYMINNSSDLAIFPFDLNIVSNIEDAEMIILKGVNQGKNAPKIEYYYGLLNKIIRQDIPLLCINPDLYSPQPDGTLHYSPGLIAKYYQDNIGSVEYFGKPHNNIYDFIFKKYKTSKTLMIGDNINTDILGAINNNIDSLLIWKTGVHKSENIDTYQYKPTYIINELR